MVFIMAVTITQLKIVCEGKNFFKLEIFFVKFFSFNFNLSIYFYIFLYISCLYVCNKFAKM